MKQEKKLSAAAGTTYTIGFDFTDADQLQNLIYLQNNGYNLYAYKGATGDGQIGAGTPTWFVESFADIEGKYTLDYIPEYLIYVSSVTQVAVGTIITMENQTPQPVELGTAWNFSESGQFTSAGTADPASISITNNSPKSQTVGLAAYINGGYTPFCAFTCPPSNTVNMTPVEEILMFAGQGSLQSGSVQAESSAPGCAFSFSDDAPAYNLIVEDDTYGLDAAPNTAPVQAVPAGQDIGELLNTNNG